MSDSPLQRHPRLAWQAVGVASVVYLLFGLTGFFGGAWADVRSLALIAAFYFVPSIVLRKDPARQAAYQVGPETPIPPWSWRAAKVVAVVCLFVFPPFVLSFLWFYATVCPGDLALLSPVLWLEGMTPFDGSIERTLAALCSGHGGSFWPEGVRVPERWLQWGGLGALLAVAEAVFAVALPEEVFHRGYLMSALEERWPPRRRVFGVPFGLAAVLSSALFAVGHLVGMAEPARLLTFFPSLLFAWLWRKSGSLWAPTLFHAVSNLLMSILLASTLLG